MIQINLIPDVKRELLKAQQQRTFVMSIALIAGAVALGITALMLIWWATQGARNGIIDDSIKSEHRKLSQVNDINQMITIQNQLGKVGGLHSGKNLTSRIYDMLFVISPSGTNAITIRELTLDTANKKIRIIGQSEGGFTALEVFKKTIANTKIIYDDKKTEAPLATDMADSDRSLTDAGGGKQLLRFTLEFTYAEKMLDSTIKDLVISGPERTNATDSYVGLPAKLFDTTGGTQ